MRDIRNKPRPGISDSRSVAPPNEKLSRRQELRGSVPVVIEGQPHILRFTLESLAAIEGDRSTGIDQVMAVLSAMLLHEGTILDYDEMDSAALSALDEPIRRCLDLSSSQSKPSRDRKPADWMKLWSYAEYDLRISEDRFWSLTPRQFHALSERHMEAELRRDLLQMNINRDREKNPQPFTVAGILREGRDSRSEKVEAVEDVQAASRRIFDSMGGKTVKVARTMPQLVKRNA